MRLKVTTKFDTVSGPDEITTELDLDNLDAKRDYEPTMYYPWGIDGYEATPTLLEIVKALGKRIEELEAKVNGENHD